MQTVISAFDDQDQAQRALDRLVEQGFSRDCVHLESGTQPSITHAGSDTAQSDDGAFEGITRFFSDLFGTSNDDASRAGRYAEAVRRGDTVLVVEAADADAAERARALMDDMGGRIGREQRAGRRSMEGAGDTLTLAGSGEADNLTDDDAFARTDTNTREGSARRATASEGATGRAGALAGTDASTRLESDTGTLPGTDTNTRLDLDAGGSTAAPDRAASGGLGGSRESGGTGDAAQAGRSDEAKVGGAYIFQRRGESTVRDRARQREQSAAGARPGGERPPLKIDKS